jgi:hypothetical protein
MPAVSSRVQTVRRRYLCGWLGGGIQASTRNWLQSIWGGGKKRLEEFKRLGRRTFFTKLNEPRYVMVWGDPSVEPRPEFSSCLTGWKGASCACSRESLSKPHTVDLPTAAQVSEQQPQPDQITH